MIYTFYSYKGGVGRSMALANVAEYLYRQGLSVLLIDWDLEAPGLESFFYDPRTEAGKESLSLIRSQLGLIDLLLAYKRHYPALKFPTNSTTTAEQVKLLEEQLPPITPHLYPIHEPGSLEDKPQAALWLISAGWREGERFSGYSQAVQNFDWSDLYINFNGKIYYEWLRAQLERTANVVLIDSRTGVTEMGGVCTRQLADVVVSFTVLNNQNMEGVAKMMKSFKRDDVQQARDGRPIETIVIPTRIETSDLSIRAGFIEEFEKVMGEMPVAFKQAQVNSYWEMAIPYSSTYAYFEKLAIGAPDKAFELEKAYINIATHLALFASEDSPIKASFAKDLKRQFGISLERVPFMAPALPDAYIARPDVLSSLSEQLLTSAGSGQVGVHVALCGPAGSGKSVIATAFARDAKVVSAFKGGILWATLGVKPDVREELKRIHFAVTGDVRSFSNSSVDDICKIIAELLADKNCLVVIDDVWSLDDLKPFLTLGNLCSYLITSRDPSLPTAINASPITVGGMTPAQALDLFTAQARTPSEYHQAIEELTTRVGTLPITLKLTSGALRSRIEGSGDEPQSALDYLNRRIDEKGLIAFDQQDATERHQSVAKNIAASLNLLNEKELERYARLALLLDNNGLSFDEVSRLWGRDKLETEDERQHHDLETEESLQRLHALSLIEYNVKEKSIRLHGALRAYLLNQLPANIGLDIKAERAFANLSPEEQLIARRLFTRLVRVARADDVGNDTRGRIGVKYLDEQAQKLVQSLSEAGLFVEEQDKLTGERKIMLADELLIKEWPRLRNWIEKDRDFLYWRQQIRPDASGWSRGQRDVYLKGPDLATAVEWATERTDDLESSEKDYIEASQRFNRRLKLVTVFTAVLLLIVLASILIWLRKWNAGVASDSDRPTTSETPPGVIPNESTTPAINANTTSIANTNLASTANANTAPANVATPSPSESPALRPRVYITAGDQKDSPVLAGMQQELNGAQFIAGDVRYDSRAVSARVTYFYPEDRKTAEAVRTIVESSLIKAGYQTNFRVGFSTNKGISRSGHIEVSVPPLTAKAR
ncbi:MAG: NB-ARC domain-containing protein [Pyrinomonadaceae bacterium]